MAKHLMLRMHIVNDDGLVFVFGNGSESTNLEAITNWILSIEDVDLIVDSYGMDSLVIKAIEHIEMIEL